MSSCSKTASRPAALPFLRFRAGSFAVILVLFTCALHLCERRGIKKFSNSATSVSALGRSLQGPFSSASFESTPRWRISACLAFCSNDTVLVDCILQEHPNATLSTAFQYLHDEYISWHRRVTENILKFSCVKTLSWASD